MNDGSTTVGIDVSKDRLDVHIRPCGRLLAVTNDREGVQHLLLVLERYDVRKVVVEASGGYEQFVFQALSDAEIAVAIVNPKQVRNFAKGAGRLAKTDAIDAAILAWFAEVFDPAATRPRSAVETCLNEYVLYRRYLIRELTALKNQLRRLTLEELRKALESRLAAVKEECRSVERAMVDIVRTCPEKRRLYDLLISVPGVGPLLACPRRLRDE